MHINTLLKMAIDMGSSDIHLKAGNNPWFRVSGNLAPLSDVKRLSSRRGCSSSRALSESISDS